VRLDGNRVAIDLPIGGAEIKSLRVGLVELCKAFLHRDNVEVSSVAVGFDNGLEFVTAGEVDQFDAELQKVEADPKQAFRLRFGTGHPQGGNAMSNDPVFGVVAPDFRVFGMENLRVCDGSLFPDVAGVNPQWTIMALAHLCSRAMQL
jgi:choline dehydrogenase-like flavoprotein